MVIDADGINALAGELKIIKQAAKSKLPVILTPHPGEISRLLKISTKEIQKKRKKVAKKLAMDYNIIAVLKGFHTIVADCKNNIYINKTGNPGMATAGSGDILTGMVAAFLGQGLNGFEASKYAVYLHGLAGDIAAKEKTQISLIASDIIERIPEAIKRR